MADVYPLAPACSAVGRRRRRRRRRLATTSYVFSLRKGQQKSVPLSLPPTQSGTWRERDRRGGGESQTDGRVRQKRQVSPPILGETAAPAGGHITPRPVFPPAWPRPAAGKGRNTIASPRAGRMRRGVWQAPPRGPQWSENAPCAHPVGLIPRTTKEHPGAHARRTCELSSNDETLIDFSSFKQI